MGHGGWEGGVGVRAVLPDVQRYEPEFRDMITEGRAGPGSAVSHELPPDAAPEAHQELDQRVDGCATVPPEPDAGWSPRRTGEEARWPPTSRTSE